MNDGLMIDPVLRKLEHGAQLDDADRTRLREAVVHTRRAAPNQDLINEGEKPTEVQVVLEGIACRYKLLPGGQRSIMALLLPGDFCDVHVSILGEMDHAIGTLSPCTVAVIARNEIDRLIATEPRITRALWWATLVDAGVLREWLVNMGQRPAEKRAAHFFCEIYVRLAAVGLTEDGSYDLPLTQAELADIFGLSPVHTNRVVQSLREAGLIVWQGKRLTLPDPARLMKHAGFNPNYLHLPVDL